MPTVKFTIDGDEHEVEIDGAHPNDVYQKGDEVVDAIEQLGYEYSESPPTIQNLADADRMTREDGVMDLGEIDDQVTGSGSGAGGGSPGTEETS
ncbi:hypothetical protein [Halorientalis regularis]|uniref:Uncharacterized protein n=1 Tax=Halorientalis regularis TaxID=660518 RepID=A0A1G7R9D2_9EURY|nr:hypothetical protein [Halorientalis regularis]SDG07411.1 hypothetical protein SAMN05216218_114113 [Halorientalis regularis]